MKATLLLLALGLSSAFAGLAVADCPAAGAAGVLVGLMFFACAFGAYAEHRRAKGRRKQAERDWWEGMSEDELPKF